MDISSYDPQDVCCKAIVVKVVELSGDVTLGQDKENRTRNVNLNIRLSRCGVALKKHND